MKSFAQLAWLFAVLLPLAGGVAMAETDADSTQNPPTPSSSDPSATSPSASSKAAGAITESGDTVQAQQGSTGSSPAQKSPGTSCTPEHKAAGQC